jgi:predicted TIM-barrel fold metal-dependent hydrolase
MTIDSHLHLDPGFESAQDAAAHLGALLAKADIERALVLHLDSQPWSIEEFADAISRESRLEACVNLDPRQSDAQDQLKRCILELGFIGLKLHPRLQGFDVNEGAVVDLVCCAGKLQIPTVVDAFPDGTYLQAGFNPLSYADLATKCPEAKQVWAHMGGHYVLDFLMLAKRLPNVALDCSYALLYYRGSDVPANMAYAMKSLKFERVFYGSDYPDRDPEESLHDSLQLLRECGLDEAAITAIFQTNAERFFPWQKN